MDPFHLAQTISIALYVYAPLHLASPMDWTALVHPLTYVKPVTILLNPSVAFICRMIIFYGVGGQVYKLHLNNDDASVGLLVLGCGIQLNDHGLDHDLLRKRRVHVLVLKHQP